MSLILGVLLLFVTPIGNEMLRSETNLRIGLLLIPFSTPLRINLLASFIILLAIYVACFAIAFKSNDGLLSNFRNLMRGSHLPPIPNWLLVMPFVTSALLFLVISLTALQDSVGVPTGSLPDVDPFILLYSLAYSPLLEEWTFRISPIGFAVCLRILISTGRFQLAQSFLSPEVAKMKAGLPGIASAKWKGIHWSDWLALGITSSIFGLAHLVAGGGWEVGKVTTATISGLALGGVFLAYGAYASILLHWFFNYYFEAIVLASNLIPSLDGIISLLTIALGIMSVGIVGKLVSERL